MGVDYLLPLYRAANSYPYLLDQGIHGNPEQLSAREIHERAWKIVEPHFLKAQHQALARFNDLSESGQTAIDIEEIIPAAYHGRVETLFVRIGEQCWGNYDPQTNRVILHAEAEPGDEDLLQYACNHTILNGGSVYALEEQRMPGDGLLAAIFRY